MDDATWVEQRAACRPEVQFRELANLLQEDVRRVMGLEPSLRDKLPLHLSRTRDG